jgi:hypothetical protein
MASIELKELPAVDAVQSNPLGEDAKVFTPSLPASHRDPFQATSLHIAPVANGSDPTRVHVAPSKE